MFTLTLPLWQTTAIRADREQDPQSITEQSISSAPALFHMLESTHWRGFQTH
jgi:hypothetical protein